MTKLTTHVLDIYSGKPGNGIVVDLFYINNNERKKINSIASEVINFPYKLNNSRVRQVKVHGSAL